MKDYIRNAARLALAFFACVLAAGCIDGGYDAPDSGTAGRGNKAVVAQNLISISELKNNFSKYIETDYRDGFSYRKIEDYTEIKGYVTGNDIEGNMYQEISIEDSTGAIIISVADGGICGYLPLGTEIIVELKDLYIGNYGRQAEIGYPYLQNDSTVRLGRLNRIVWNEHFNYTGRHKEIEPVEFDKDVWDRNPTDYAGRLAVIKNVQFNVNNDTTTYATPGSAGSKTLFFRGLSNRIEVYNSNYADFAASYVPRGTVNVTGVVKRYNGYWEFILRKADDVQIVK